MPQLNDSNKRAKQLANDWVNYYLTGDESKFYATEYLVELTSANPEKAWEIMKLINSINVDDDSWGAFIDGVLAAGPLEDLLSHHGEHYINILELEAERNPRLIQQIKTLYKHGIPDDVWNRLLKIVDRANPGHP